MENRANNSVNASGTDPFKLTADFWLDETLSHLSKSRFAIVIPYRFLMQLILSEKQKYEINKNS